MEPGPWISPIVNVLLPLITTDGETFQPLPRSRDAPLPVPSVAIPALPFSPVKFSGEIERVLAADSRDRLPRFMWSPLNFCWAKAVPVSRAISIAMAGQQVVSVFMGSLLF